MDELSEYKALIRKYVYKNYKGMLREPGGAFKYPFLTPGSSQYADVLWDWDSWFANIAIRQVLQEIGDKKESEKVLEYEKGCVLNFLEWGEYGWLDSNIC